MDFDLVELRAGLNRCGTTISETEKGRELISLMQGIGFFDGGMKGRCTDET